jgi:hypothetical protein
MSKRNDYLAQVDFCRSMADRAVDFETKARWLELACKWMTLAGDGGSASDQFEAAVRNKATGQERSRSTN